MSKITDYTVLSAADPADVLVIVDVSDTTQSAQGTTKQVTVANAAAGTSPMTTLGDIAYENSTPAPARLAGNTTSTKKYLTQTGTGSVSAAPAWGTIAAADLPAATTGAQGAVILDGTGTDIQPVGAQTAGAVGKAADAGHIHATPMTAKGDLLTMNATPAPAKLTVGSVNQVLGVSSGAPAWQTAYTRQAATANAGYTMVNATGTIITFTTPNDGNVHSVMVSVSMHTTTTMTGGRIDISFTDASGTSTTFTSILAGGFTAPATNTDNFVIFCAANTAVNWLQGTAMSGGAAKVWAELWCS